MDNGHLKDIIVADSWTKAAPKKPKIKKTQTLPSMIYSPGMA